MTRPTETDSRAEGFLAGTSDRKLTRDQVRRLRHDPAYWRGFHEGRAASKFDLAEDPTRPGGWYIGPWRGWAS